LKTTTGYRSEVNILQAISFPDRPSSYGSFSPSNPQSFQEDGIAANDRDHIRSEHLAESFSRSAVEKSAIENPVESSAPLGLSGLGISSSVTMSAAPQSQESASRPSNMGGAGLRLSASKSAVPRSIEFGEQDIDYHSIDLPRNDS
jgi:hypothetical protein